MATTPNDDHLTGARADEWALWDAVVTGQTPREAGARLGIPAKRVAYLCGKWSRRHVYDYGTTVDLGWAVR